MRSLVAVAVFALAGCGEDVDLTGTYLGNMSSTFVCSQGFTPAENPRALSIKVNIVTKGGQLFWTPSCGDVLLIQEGDAAEFAGPVECKVRADGGLQQGDHVFKSGRFSLSSKSLSLVFVEKLQLRNTDGTAGPLCDIASTGVFLRE